MPPRTTPSPRSACLPAGVPAARCSRACAHPRAATPGSKPPCRPRSASAFTSVPSRRWRSSGSFPARPRPLRPPPAPPPPPPPRRPPALAGAPRRRPFLLSLPGAGDLRALSPRGHARADRRGRRGRRVAVARLARRGAGAARGRAGHAAVDPLRTHRRHRAGAGRAARAGGAARAAGRLRRADVPPALRAPRGAAGHAGHPRLAALPLVPVQLQPAVRRRAAGGRRRAAALPQRPGGGAVGADDLPPGHPARQPAHRLHRRGHLAGHGRLRQRADRHGRGAVRAVGLRGAVVVARIRTAARRHALALPGGVLPRRGGGLQVPGADLPAAGGAVRGAPPAPPAAGLVAGAAVLPDPVHLLVRAQRHHDGRPLQPDRRARVRLHRMGAGRLRAAGGRRARSRRDAQRADLVGVPRALQCVVEALRRRARGGLVLPVLGGRVGRDLALPALPHGLVPAARDDGGRGLAGAVRLDRGGRAAPAPRAPRLRRRAPPPGGARAGAVGGGGVLVLVAVLGAVWVGQTATKGSMISLTPEAREAFLRKHVPGYGVMDYVRRNVTGRVYQIALNEAIYYGPTRSGATRWGAGATATTC